MSEYEESPNNKPDNMQRSRETGARMAARAIGSATGRHEQVASVPDFMQILSGIPNRFSDDLNIEQQHDYREASETRWASLRKAVGRWCGVTEEAITEQWVSELLDEFARQPAPPQTSNLPSDYRRVYAAMLWEHLQGARPATIKEVARQYGWIYGVTELTSVREAVVRYAAKTRKTGTVYNNVGDQSTPRKVRGENNKPPDLQYLNKLNRDIEDRALMDYKRPEKKRNSTVDRERRANVLQKYLGGNIGAYRRMLSLSAEVVVDEESEEQAKSALLGAVREMVKPSVRATLPHDLRLNISIEARWLVRLCGKELVTDGSQWFLRPEHSLTLQDIRDRVYRESPPNHKTQAAERTERIVLDALDKVTEYKKRMVPNRR